LNQPPRRPCLDGAPRPNQGGEFVRSDSMCKARRIRKSRWTQTNKTHITR